MNYKRFSEWVEKVKEKGLTDIFNKVGDGEILGIWWSLEDGGRCVVKLDNGKYAIVYNRYVDELDDFEFRYELFDNADELIKYLIEWFILL